MKTLIEIIEEYTEALEGYAKEYHEDCVSDGVDMAILNFQPVVETLVAVVVDWAEERFKEEIDKIEL